MLISKEQILTRHSTSLRGRLRAEHIDSRVLGIRKPYFVYEPPDLSTLRRVPLLYLFRGHEREWVNMNEDRSRKKTTAIEDLDQMIAEGTIPPVVAVMPGLNSSNNHIPSLGIDMVGTWLPTHEGLGTGRFWHFLTREMLPGIERDYPETRGGRRLMAGFSLGGYTVSLLASQCPGYFDHAGIYDGTFMWPGHNDPRQKQTGTWSDRIWCKAPIFDAALGMPRVVEAMRRWNATDAISMAQGHLLDQLQQTTFYVACAASDGMKGNRDRATFFVDLLRKKAIPLASEKIIFAIDAAHTWHWADLFLTRFLTTALAAPDYGTA